MEPRDEYHFYDLINSVGKEILCCIEFITLEIYRSSKQGKPIGRHRKSRLDTKRAEIMAYKAIGYDQC